MATGRRESKRTSEIEWVPNNGEQDARDVAPDDTQVIAENLLQQPSGCTRAGNKIHVISNSATRESRPFEGGICGRVLGTYSGEMKQHNGQRNQTTVRKKRRMNVST